MPKVVMLGQRVNGGDRSVGGRSFKGRSLGLVLGAIGLLTVAGCGGAPQSASSPTGGSGPADKTLKLLYWQAPTVLNPHLATGNKDFDAARVAYEPLASYDSRGKLVLFLAAEEPTLENGGIAKDGRSVTWKLKPGVKWSDGKPFTAEDVAFTYQFLSDPKTAATTTTDYATVKAVRAIDPLTVKVEFKAPTANWSQPFMGYNGMILPKHIFAEFVGAKAKEAPANLQPIGTGPYQVVSFKPGDAIVYEPNPNYRDRAALAFDRVEIKGGGDPTSAARAVMQTGDADYAYNPQVEAPILKQLAAAGKGQLQAVTGSQSERIHFNFTDPNKATADGERSSVKFPHPFFTDKTVREAFALAVDRNTIVQQLYGPTGSATANLIIAPAAVASKNTQFEFNLQKAAQLLDQAGWKDTNNNKIRDKNGVEMQVLFVTSVNPLRQKTQEIIKQAWESIGIGVELKSVDAGAFFSGDPANPDTVNRFQSDLQLYTTGNTSPDPSAHLQWWTCAEIASKANDWNRNNYTRYCNPEFDKAWAAADKERDPVKRQAAMIDLNDRLIRDVALIPLVARAKVGAVSNRLTGVDLTPWDGDTWNIATWKRP
jgi:peptide/nickel transport system substrate-binding protein